MKRTMACSSGNVSDFIRSEKLPSSSEVLESLWIPESSSSALRGGKSMVDFEDVNGGSAEAGGDTTVAPFFKIHCLDKEEINGYYDDFDGSLSNPPAKKRRLTASQVQFLEKHFEAENKLEPDRKIQLAKEVGLEPRQVAIWFQNRRARFKNQRLEKDYGLLKAAYDKLKADYDCLLKEKEGLQSQVVSFREKVLFGKHQENPEKHDSAITKSLEPETQHAETKAETKTMFGLAVCKQEDASSAASAKSEIFDSDSSHDTDGNHSSSIMEPEQSDFSQDEEDNITNHNNNIDNVNNVLFPPPFLLKLEEDCCFDDPPIGSCNLGLFSIDDQQQTPLWSWPYELEC